MAPSGVEKGMVSSFFSISSYQQGKGPLIPFLFDREAALLNLRRPPAFLQPLHAMKTRIY